jgi:hypothetical protein
MYADYGVMTGVGWAKKICGGCIALYPLDWFRLSSYSICISVNIVGYFCKQKVCLVEDDKVRVVPGTT